MSRADPVCMRCDAHEGPQDAEAKRWRVVLAMRCTDPADKPIAVAVRPFLARTRAYEVDEEVRAVTGVLCSECLDKEVGELMEREAELWKAGDELLSAMVAARIGATVVGQKFASVLYLRQDPAARAAGVNAVNGAAP